MILSRWWKFRKGKYVSRDPGRPENQASGPLTNDSLPTEPFSNGLIVNLAQVSTWTIVDTQGFLVRDDISNCAVACCILSTSPGGAAWVEVSRDHTKEEAYGVLCLPPCN